MSPKQLHRRWHRRLTALEERIGLLFSECRSTGSAEAIHDLRVAIRRARLYAQIGRPLLRKETAKQFDAWAKNINKLLGPVRDCDVCLNWLAGCTGATEAIQLVHEERVRLWRRAFVGLNRRKSDLSGGTQFRKSDKGHWQKLMARYSNELEQIREAVASAMPRLERMAPTELHDLRRLLRRWRYLRELGLPRRAHPQDRVLGWLVRVQDALGESQNLQMAVTLLQRHPEWHQRERFTQRARTEQARWIARARLGLLRMPPAPGLNPRQRT